MSPFKCLTLLFIPPGSNNNLAISSHLVVFTLLRILKSTLLISFCPLTVKTSFTGIKEKPDSSDLNACWIWLQLVRHLCLNLGSHQIKYSHGNPLCRILQCLKTFLII